MFNKLIDKISSLSSANQQPVVKRKNSKDLSTKTHKEKSFKDIPAHLIISKKENIPSYDEVLSAQDGSFHIEPEKTKLFIVLYSKENQEVIFLSSFDYIENNRNDIEYLSLKERFVTTSQDLDYKKISRYHVPSSLINLLYERDRVTQVRNEDVKNLKGLQASFNDLALRALNENVSDIHIEVKRDEALVRFRKNGRLHDAGEWGVQYAREMAVVIYQVIAEEQDVTFVESQQQSAIIDRKIGEHRVRIRLNTIPAYPDGFNMVMRLLKMGVSNDDINLNTLGYFPEQVEMIKSGISRPVGVTVIAGVTGSGKSTSLAAMLSDIVRQHTTPQGVEIKIITVEDPPEYDIPHVTQSPVVNSRGGKTRAELFIEAIKAALRCDPDVLMIGEVRDKDSADLLSKAVLTGHKGFTTIHAPSVFSIISRLRNEGVSDDILCSKDFFSTLIYQTLVPVVCNECAHTSEKYFELHKNDDVADKLKLRINEVTSESDFKLIKFKNKNGCSACNNLGIIGRTVVAEILLPDDEMRDAIAKKDEALLRKIFVKNGGKFALDYGIDKMHMGLCDPNDVEEKLGRLDEDRLATPAVEKEFNLNDVKQAEFTSKLLSGKNTGESHVKHVDFQNKNNKNRE